MHFVHKHDGAAAGATRVFGGGHDVLNLANTGKNGAVGDKFGMRAARDQSCERGLAAAGRAPENHRAEIVGFDGGAQRLTGSKQRLLSGELLERARAHAFGERRAGRGDFGFDFGEKAHGRLAHYI